MDADISQYIANDDEILKIYCYYTVIAKITFLVSYRNNKYVLHTLPHEWHIYRSSEYIGKYATL